MYIPLFTESFDKSPLTPLFQKGNRFVPSKIDNQQPRRKTGKKGRLVQKLPVTILACACACYKVPH